MTRFRIAAFLLTLAVTSRLSAQEATVQEEKQTFKTYPFSGPDPAPIMTRSSMWGSGASLYPYFFFEHPGNGCDKLPRKIVARPATICPFDTVTGRNM